MDNILKYVSEELFNEYKKNLKTGQTKTIYSDESIDIEIQKVGRKIYTFINHYGNKKLNEALNNICGLV